MTLYEIDKEIMNCWDAETGEILDEARLDELQIERDAKIENVACWIKNLRAEREALKAEKDTFAQRQKTVENKIDSLMKYLQSALNGENFKTAKTAITYRKSEKVVIADGVDIFALPEQYLKYKDPDLDKAALKRDVKAGIEIPGVFIESCKNIQIK